MSKYIYLALWRWIYWPPLQDSIQNFLEPRLHHLLIPNPHIWRKYIMERFLNVDKNKSSSADISFFFEYWSQKMKKLQKKHSKLVGKRHDINVVNLHRVKYISRFWSCMNEMVSWQPDGLITWGGDCLVLGHHVELFLHKYLDFIK